MSLPQKIEGFSKKGFCFYFEGVLKPRENIQYRGGFCKDAPPCCLSRDKMFFGIRKVFEELKEESEQELEIYL